MRLGKECGSLVNHLHSRGVIGQPDPVVGMGASILSWSDRHAASIYGVWIKKPGKPEICQPLSEAAKLLGYSISRIVVGRDIAKRVDNNGLSECQDYEFSPDPNARPYYFRIGRNGLWEQIAQNDVGRWVKAGGQGLRIGKRDEYHDFSF